MAIVLSGAIEISARTTAQVRIYLQLVKAISGIPVLVGGLSSVYACDAIDHAGAESLGRDVDHGLQRLAQILSGSVP